METVLRVPPSPPPIVLIVEDDADTREMYHTALEFEGFWVVDAPQVSEAVVCAAEIMPDIIVTDIGLAGPLDGLALARQLRSDVHTATIPLLAVTGQDPRALGDQCTLFEDVLLKPVLPDLLSQKIKETLERSVTLRVRSEAVRARVPKLLAQARRLLDRSTRVLDRTGRLSPPPRPCPCCGGALIWSERRKRHGVAVDYYRPCENGCGSFCYNRSERRIVPLTD